LIDHNDAIDVIEDLAWYEDEPNADPVCIPLYFVSKLTRESGTTVIQVGEGSDEQFVGYRWMMREWNFYNSYWNSFKKLPNFIQKAAYGMLKMPLLAADQYLPLDYLRRGTFDEELYWGGISILAPSHQKDLFKNIDREYIYNASNYGSELHRQALELYPKADYLQRMIYNELTNRIAEMLLMRVDKMGMAHSLEARVPFLDHRLVEFTMSLSPVQKLADGKETKQILKKAVESILPENIIYRKKMGFAAPVSEWFRTHWYGYAESEIMNSYFVKEEIFNKDFIYKMLRRHKAGKANYSQQIFSLLMLSLWHKKWF
jgi:asparagine synthase (glutamine-hydrolysing)